MGPRLIQMLVTLALFNRFVSNFLTFPKINLSSSRQGFNDFELKYNVYFNSFLTLIMNFSILITALFAD